MKVICGIYNKCSVECRHKDIHDYNKSECRGQCSEGGECILARGVEGLEFEESISEYEGSSGEEENEEEV